MRTLWILVVLAVTTLGAPARADDEALPSAPSAAQLLTMTADLVKRGEEPHNLLADYMIVQDMAREEHAADVERRAAAEIERLGAQGIVAGEKQLGWLFWARGRRREEAGDLEGARACFLEAVSHLKAEPKHRKYVEQGLGRVEAKLADRQAQTPRAGAAATLERAAFAEEHQRDLEGALELYEEALRGAEQAKDEKTAAEAKAGRDRVLGRLGRAPRGAGGAPASLDVGRRVDEIVLSLAQSGAPITNDRWRNAVQQVALFGAAAVPQLEVMIANGNVGIGAVALAAIDDPAAVAALGRALASPDPTVRLAVVGALSPGRHAALLVRAARDRVEQVRDRAKSAISLAAMGRALPADPEVIELLDEEVRKGAGVIAARGLAALAPARARAIAVDRSASETARSVALDACGGWISSRTLPEEAVEVALRALEAGGPRALTVTALQILVKNDELLGDARCPAGLDDRTEGEAVALLLDGSYEGDDVSGQCLTLLGACGEIAGVEAILARGPQPLTERQAAALRVCAGRTDGRLLDRVVAAVRARVAAHPEVTPESLIDIVAAPLDANTPDADIVANLDAFGGGWREAYVGKVALRKDGPRSAALAPAFRVALRSERGAARAAAIDALDRALGADALPDVIAALRDRDRAARSAAVKVFRAHADDPRAAGLLGEVVTRAATDPAHDTLPSPFEELRLLTVAERLTIVGRAWPVASPEPRAYLAKTLFGISSPTATAFLVDHYAELDQAYQRAGVAERVGKELYAPAIPLLGKALDDPDEAVRSAAREALAKFKAQRDAKAEFAAWASGDAEARATEAELEKLLESPRRDVVIGAVRGLAAIGARGALPKLVALLARDDAELKKAVQEAIARIGDEKSGDRVK